MRCRHHHRRVADPGGKHLRDPARLAPAVPHYQKRSDQGTNHIVAERVRDNAGHKDAGCYLVPVQAQQLAHCARALAPAAERREVVRAEACCGGVVHTGGVDRPWVPERVVPAQRVRRRRVVADAVGVTPPQPGKPGIEPVGCRANGPHPEVGRQQPGQAPGSGLASRFPGL